MHKLKDNLTVNIKIVENINGNEEYFISFLKDNNIDLVVLSWWPTIIKSESIKAVNDLTTKAKEIDPKLNN